MRVWIVAGCIINLVIVMFESGAASDDIHLLLYPDEDRSEGKQQSPPNYTGWSPELAQRDRGGGRRGVTAPDGAVLENTLSMFAELERNILVCISF